MKGRPPCSAVLVPALDCGSTIAAVVHGACEHIEHVLVVDDGSTDTTAAKARAAGAAAIQKKAEKVAGAKNVDNHLGVANP